MANMAQVVPWYVASDELSSLEPPSSVKILIANVYMRNLDYERLVQLVEEEQPDILGLMEVDSLWLENLASIRKMYNFGLENR